jgi:hypothetical protein
MRLAAQPALGARDLGLVVGMRDRALGDAQTQRTQASSLAQVVILTVIPQATTAPNQTGLTRIST